MSKEALEKYGRHYEDCHLEKNALIKPYVCTCGFSEALLRAEEPPQGEFTKLWRTKLENAVALFKMGRRPNDWFRGIVVGFREALYRLDRQAAHIKLLQECDDSSTKVIGEQAAELKAKDEKIERLET